MFSNLEIKEEGSLTILAINRPEQLNSLDTEVLQEMGKWLEENRDQGRILIITGKGKKAFVAGADIAAMKDMTPLEAEQFSSLGQRVFSLLYHWPAPTIAAINGYALGGGCELSLFCDFRYMKKGAKIGQPEITLGIIPGFGGTYFLKKIIGEALAKDLIFTGRLLSAEEAKEYGLVHMILEEEDFLSSVIKHVKNLEDKSLLALRSAKNTINDDDISQALIKERTLFGELFSSHDQKEGMSAFLEKRKPSFKNSD